MHLAHRLWQIVICCTLLPFAWITSASSTLADRHEHPNVVFLLADDLGWRDLGCYGSPFCETPHLDRLAESSVRFSSAYTAASICSPTRASLMTGRHPVRTGITDYIPGLKSTADQMPTPRTKRQLALHEVTLGELFRSGGYQTFYAGKWHLGGKGFEPTEQGFEVYVGDDQLGNHRRETQVSQRLVDAFDDFLSAQHDPDKPFLAYLAFHEPHLPILKYPEFIEHFQDKAGDLGPSPEPLVERDGLTRTRQDHAAYGSEVGALDDYVGQVLNLLEQRHLADETIIVFFSDNGGLSTKAKPGPTSNRPLRAGKGWLYEGGIRVPLLIHVPGETESAEVCDEVVVSTDLLPTLLDLAGLPSAPQAHVDGISFASLVKEPSQELPERTLYWHYPHYHGSTWSPGAAVRRGDWKLIQLDALGELELYNLADDIGEKNNLVTEEPELARDLQQDLLKWQRSMNAPQATPRNLLPEELVAWCIVPFDAAQRTPEQRAKMLRELGIRRLAYDWREEHVPTWDDELDALQEHGIELTAFWCSSSLDPVEDPNMQRILDFLRRREQATQLWIMLPDARLQEIADESRRIQRAAQAVRQLAEHVAAAGCSVGLYNHGGWIGQPDTLVQVMQELSDLDNVGIVYNFHHAHEDLEDFPNALLNMKPYLMCLNLNGTTPQGPKIQSIGEGTLDTQILDWIRMAQYKGPIGILDHRNELDAKESLERNLDGLRDLLSVDE